jgi:hypothetical protein
MQLVQGQIGLSAGGANIMDYAIVPDPVNQHDKARAYSFESSCVFWSSNSNWISFEFLSGLTSSTSFQKLKT